MKTIISIFRWCLLLFLGLLSLALLKDNLYLSLIILVSVSISSPIFDNFFKKKKDFYSVSRWVVFSVGLFGIMLLVNQKSNNDLVLLDEELNEVYTLLETSELDSAKSMLIELKTKHPLNINKLENLITEIEDIQSYDFLTKSLMNLNEEEYNKIASGSDFEILKNKNLNTIFMDSLRTHSDLRNTLINQSRDEKLRKEKKKDKENREMKIKKLFSPWDGSHKELVKHVKKNMNDPESFEHVETKYTDNGNNLTIYMTYRGKNGFGAIVKEKLVASIDLEGKIIQIY